MPSYIELPMESLATPTENLATQPTHKVDSESVVEIGGHSIVAKLDPL